jgi:hypothetical protein
MNITARMVCQSVTLFPSSEVITMRAIWSGHPEDNNYSSATPNGTFEITVSNEAIFGAFKPGSVYNFLITPHEGT